MARIYTVREVCERALRKIGAYSIRHSGADAAEMKEARYWLDMVMGHLAARRQTWWLVQETATIGLQDGVSSYVLAAELPSGDPFSAPIMASSVSLTDSRREPVQIARRAEWEERDATHIGGRPLMVYVDRLPNHTLSVWPTPAAPVNHRLELVFQRVSPDLVTGDVTARLVKFREAWNLYIVVALAAQIGNGPVRKLPADEVRDMQGEADRLLFDLETFDGHEQAGEPRLTAYHAF